MDAYIFQAALLCSDCANAVFATNTANPDDRENSDHWPQGPYADGGGEADTPQHCDHCGVFLENSLTPDGGEYVREKAKQFETGPDMSWQEIAELAGKNGQPALHDWILFYLAWGS
jgi:hypothetical protein